MTVLSLFETLITLIKEEVTCNHTYDHVVTDVTERRLLEDVLHEAVSRRVELQGVACLGA